MTAYILRAIPKSASFKSAIITACSLGSGYLRLPILADSLEDAIAGFRQIHGETMEVVHVLSSEEVASIMDYIHAAIGKPYVPAYASMGIKRNIDGTIPDLTSEMILGASLSLLATTGEDTKAAMKEAFRLHPSHFYFCVMSMDELKDDLLKMHHLECEMV